MMDLGNLAERLVDLSCDYDPYEFHDNYTDKEEALCEVLKSLETGDVEAFVLFCDTIIEEYVEDPDEYDRDLYGEAVLVKENLEELFLEYNAENVERE